MKFRNCLLNSLNHICSYCVLCKLDLEKAIFKYKTQIGQPNIYNLVLKIDETLVFVWLLAMRFLRHSLQLLIYPILLIEPLFHHLWGFFSCFLTLFSKQVIIKSQNVFVIIKLHTIVFSIVLTKILFHENISFRNFDP